MLRGTAPKTSMLSVRPTEKNCQRKTDTLAAISPSVTLGKRAIGTSLLRGNIRGHTLQFASAERQLPWFQLPVPDVGVCHPARASPQKSCDNQHVCARLPLPKEDP